MNFSVASVPVQALQYCTVGPIACWAPKEVGQSHGLRGPALQPHTCRPHAAFSTCRARATRDPQSSRGRARARLLAQDGGPHVVISVARAPRLAAHQQTIGGASRAEARSAIQPAAARAGGRKEEDVVPAPPSSPHRQDNSNQHNRNRQRQRRREEHFFSPHRSVRFGHPSPPPFSDPVPPPRTAARRTSERARSAPVPGPGGRAPRVEVMRSVSRSCRLQVTRVHLPSPASVGIWECGCLDPLPLDGRAISGQG